MSWRDADELVVASDGEAYFADVGSTLPQPGDDPEAALDSALWGAGYLTEDGASLSVGSEVAEIMAWQSRQAIRREKTGQEITVSFGFKQWNEQNVVNAFGGGTVTDEGGGLYSYTFPDEDDPLAERALVLDARDGEVNYRFVFPRGNVTEPVETQFQRGASADLAITFKALQPSSGGPIGWFLTDAPGFATGS